MASAPNYFWLHQKVMPNEPSNLVCRLKLVHYWHRKVHKDQAVGELFALKRFFYLLKSFMPVVSFIYELFNLWKASLPQHYFESELVVRLIVNNQYSSILVHFHSVWFFQVGFLDWVRSFIALVLHNLILFWFVLLFVQTKWFCYWQILFWNQF